MKSSVHKKHQNALENWNLSHMHTHCCMQRRLINPGLKIMLLVLGRSHIHEETPRRKEGIYGSVCAIYCSK